MYILKTSTPKGISDAELKVLSEKKNYQDFAYQTNASLQGLSSGLVSLSLLYEKAIAKSDSDRKAMQIDLENFKQEIQSIAYGLNQRMGDVEERIKRLTADVSRVSESCGQYVTKEYHANNDFTISVQQDLLERKIELLKEYHSNQLQILKAQMSSDLSQAKKELTPVEPEIDPVQQMIDERLANSIFFIGI